MDGVLRMNEAGLTKYLRLMLHDEVLMSVPIQEYEQIVERTIECLSTTWTPPGLKFAVPIEASAGLPGSTWADCYRGESDAWSTN
jgi:DNA polymerase-1